MEIITFESKAYKELDNKITAIADYIFNHLDENKTDEDEIWVDSYEVCTFLKISGRTLQRLRAAGMISYSDIKGHYFYKIKEVKRMLEERLIKRDKECINELITNHQKYVKYLQPIITQYFIDNKSEIWLLFLIAHSKR